MSETLNNATKGAELKIKLIERDEGNDESVWEVSNAHRIDVIYGGVGRSLPAGTTFRYDDVFSATEEDVDRYISNRGIQNACGISLGDFERDWEDQGEYDD